jgi:hypothetical protein
MMPICESSDVGPISMPLSQYRLGMHQHKPSQHAHPKEIITDITVAKSIFARVL